MDARPASRSADKNPTVSSLGTLAAAALIVGASLAQRRGPVDHERDRGPAGDDRRRHRGGGGERSARASSKTPDRPSRDRDPAHGRHADTPSEIPRSGWMDIAKRVIREFSRDRLLATAAGVTFYALLALFPAIAAFVSLYGLFFSPEQVTSQVAALSGAVPDGALEVIEEQVQRVASAEQGSLSFGFAFGLLASLWSANAGMKAIFDALNVVYDEEEERGFVKLTLVTLCFTIGAFVIIGALVASIAIMPALFAAVPMGDTVETLARWLRYPIALVLLAGLLALLYRYAPSRTRPRWRWVMWGALAGATAWVVFSLLFTWYVANFGSYNATYGSLGAVVGFMVWIWLSTTIVLLAAEFNAEMERQTAKDTTDAPHRPLGARGAQAADTVAERP